MRLAELGPPEAASVGHDGQLGHDDGAADGSRHLEGSVKYDFTFGKNPICVKIIFVSGHFRAPALDRRPGQDGPGDAAAGPAARDVTARPMMVRQKNIRGGNAQWRLRKHANTAARLPPCSPWPIVRCD